MERLLDSRGANIGARARVAHPLERSHEGRIDEAIRAPCGPDRSADGSRQRWTDRAGLTRVGIERAELAARIEAGQLAVEDLQKALELKPDRLRRRQARVRRLADQQADARAEQLEAAFVLANVRALGTGAHGGDHRPAPSKVRKRGMRVLLESGSRA